MRHIYLLQPARGSAAAGAAVQPEATAGEQRAAAEQHPAPLLRTPQKCNSTFPSYSLYQTPQNQKRKEVEIKD